MRTDPALLAGFALAAESIANESLRYDPGSKAALKKLAGERLALIFSDRETVLQLDIFESELGIRIVSLPDYDGDASTTLKGDLADFIQLARQSSHSLSGTGVEVQGNIATLEALQGILKNIDIDWQDALYQKLGPAAVPLNTLISNVSDYLKHATNSKAQTLKHYIQHESALGVQKAELSLFQSEVARLRQASDRLEARLQHLKRNPMLQSHTKKDDA